MHIHTNAPGPPIAIATATPAIFPVPILPAIDVAKPWNDDIPTWELSPSSKRVNISFTSLIWKNFNFNEKYNPIHKHIATNTGDQTIPLMVLTKSVT